MKNRVSLVLSVIALLISTGNFIYYFWLSEKGPISAKPQYFVTMSESIKIENEFNGITFSPFIEIYNTGNKAGNISRISATLALKNAFKKDLRACSYTLPVNNMALAPAAFSVAAGKTWSATVAFCLPPKEQDLIEKSELDFDIANYLQAQYLTLRNNSIPYFISDSLHEKVKKIMGRNVEWIEEGEYTMTIMLWDDPRSKTPTWKKDYGFRLSREVIKGIKEYQINAYKVPPKYVSNWYMRFILTPFVLEIQ